MTSVRAPALFLLAALLTGACGGEDPAASPPHAAKPNPHGGMAPAVSQSVGMKRNQCA